MEGGQIEEDEVTEAADLRLKEEMARLYMRLAAVELKISPYQAEVLGDTCRLRGWQLVYVDSLIAEMRVVIELIEEKQERYIASMEARALRAG